MHILVMFVVVLFLIGWNNPARPQEIASPVMAQEHDHGVGGLPDWYDPSCCNLRDCRPVDDKDIEFVTQGGSDFVRHIPTGLLFQRSQWKTSQDERYHVCIWNGSPMCVYIRAGA